MYLPKSVVGVFAAVFLLLSLASGSRAAGFTVLTKFPIPDAEVQSVVVDAPHNVVYIAGVFTSVGGVARSYLAALNATTGAVLPWNPTVDGIVHEMLLSGGYLYVVGDFTHLNGIARKSIGAFGAVTDLASSTAVLSAFDPNPSGDTVGCMATDGTNIYVGGFFSGVGGQATYARLAKLDPLSGAAVAGWVPNPDNGVTRIAVNGSEVYATGFFTMIGGANRARLASLDKSTGVATAWNPAPLDAFDAATHASFLQIAGSRLYVSGNIKTIAGVTRGNLVAFDTGTNALDANFDPNADGAVSSMAVDGDIFYVSGGFLHIGGEARQSLAAIDASSGFAAGWNPGASGSINAIAASASTVFIGAYNSSTIGGVTPNPGPFNFAAVTKDAVIPPNHPPVVKIKGKKRVTTKKSTAVIRGTATDAEGKADISSVTGRVGKKTYRPIGTSSWSFRAVLKPGANKVTVTAKDTRGTTSKAATITIIRK